MRNEKYATVYGRIGEMFQSSEKSGSRYTMVTSDLRAELEILAVLCMRNASGRNEQFIHCGRGYETDTKFHRTYF